MSKISRFCDCDFDSQIAYVSKTTNKTDIINPITILDYLDDPCLMKQIELREYFLICQEGRELIKYQSENKKSHFKHKNSVWNGMSDWHKNWQNKFKQTEVKIGNRRADAVIENNVLEFQYSKITKDNVIARQKNYEDHHKNLNWIIYCDDINIVLNYYSNGNCLVTFESDFWRYENFTSHQFIYLNIDGNIIKINPSMVRCHMVSGEIKSEDIFVSEILNGKNIWENKESLPTLIVNERGAGNGKTFEGVQRANYEYKYDTFLYLTKRHSGKDVIYQEYKSQLSNGLLDNLEEIENDILGKRYVFSFQRKDTDKKIKVIIGTVDSFIFTISDGKGKNSGPKFFIELAKSVQNGNTTMSKDGTIDYTKHRPKLNSKCLIVIDETQDLEPEYGYAIVTLMKITKMDVCILGNILQSIDSHENTQTMLLKTTSLDGIKIQHDLGKNKVKRFHNKKFIGFVNDIIRFDNFDLPQIEGCCDGECKYVHEDHLTPYHFFQVKNKFDRKTLDIENEVEDIITKMKQEIDKYDYLPNNFMFIFPILSGNQFVDILESRIQDFWIKQFNDQCYQDKIKQHPFWSSILNNSTIAGYKFVFKHKSEDGKAINLIESENSTQILSIHASKGNGREVVFLLDVTEGSLRHFSKQNDLVYESLLHVAITRQKKSIYIGIELNGDDIHRRFVKYPIVKNSKIELSLNSFKKSIKYDGVSSFGSGNHFEPINAIIKNENYDSKIPKNDDKENTIIDWGHHLIRYSVLIYNFISNIINDKVEFPQRDQFTTILRKFTNPKFTIESYFYKDYMEKLRQISKIRKNGKEVYHIPILKFESSFKFEYNRYTEYINKIMKHIIKKITDSFEMEKFPILCPLESVILLHMISVRDQGKYNEPSIMDIYHIIKCYEDFSDDLDENHDLFGCKCREFFKFHSFIDKNIYQEIRQSIKIHYDGLERINTIYKNYILYTEKNYSSKEDFIYNYSHIIVKEDDNFKLYQKFQLISHSKTHVIVFYFLPQFNKLNFYDKIFKIIFDVFLLQNIRDEDNKDYERYNNKKVVACIITLETKDPIFFEIDTVPHRELLLDIIKKYLFEKFSSHHILVYDFYQYCKETRPKDESGKYKIDSFKFTYDKISKCNISFYIKDYFNDMNKMTIEEKKTLSNQLNKETLQKALDQKLEVAIQNFLGLNVEAESCDF